ncbi:MAG: T9SS C-terminal target domain-containing protein [Sphingobacteriales bacterium]|nr:MAG: T9SS C-terminal target domain-containing protein [Sphingobacteriales bacterium]
MKYVLSLLLLVIFQLLITRSSAQRVGIGTANPAPSAQLDISSTTRGLLPPRMTKTERDAISNPAAGLIIFNNSSSNLEIFDGFYWMPLVKGSTASGSAAVRKLYGGYDSDYIYSMQPANDGGFFMTGYSRSSNSGTLAGINNNSIDAEMWVMKTDAAGNLEWQKLLGGINADFAYSINTTSDGGCILAGTSTVPSGGIFSAPGYGMVDGLIIKLNAEGGLQWYKLMGGSNSDYLLCIQQTTDGGYIACGYTTSSNSGTLTGITGAGANEGWIVKMDNAGNVIWQKLLGGTSSETLYAIIQTPDGGYLVAGNSMSSNTGTLLGVYNNGAYDIWIIKLDAGGILQWQKLLGGSANDNSMGFSGGAVKRTSDGGYIVGAYSSSSNSGTLTGITNNGLVDLWIIKLDEFGSLQWQKLLGGSEGDYCYAIIQTTDGGYVAAGYSASSKTGTLSGYTSNGQSDAWIIKMDNTGNVQWQKLLGGSSADIAYSITQISGGFAVAGHSNSPGTGYLTALSGNGGIDGWFFKLDMFGNTY